MKRYLYIMVLSVSLLFTPAAHARDYIIVMSPAHQQDIGTALKKALFEFLMTHVKPGEKVTGINGQSLETWFVFEVKDDPKYNYPKIKARMNAPALRAIQTFGFEVTSSQLPGGVQIPQLYQYLGQNFAPFDDTTIIMLASPLYQDQYNPDWGIMNELYPSDGHLNSPIDATPFSVVGRGELLKGATIHWGHPYPWDGSDAYRLKVTRFQHLLAEGYGATIATFTSDMASLWRRVKDNAAPVPHGFTRDTTEKLETIQLIDRPVDETRTSIYERELETGKPSAAELRQARNVEIGISWSAEHVDLDLHVQPHAGAEVLYFANRQSTEGFYHKDFTQSPETENGYETITMTVPLDLPDTLIAINWFGGGSADGVTGEIRLAIGDKTYGMPFEMNITRGNSGGGREDTIRTRNAANANWLIIDPKTIIGL